MSEGGAGAWLGAPARWWEPAGEGRVRCGLCPHRCLLRSGQAGLCGVRRNEGGQLWARSWGRPLGLAADPIEKKPLYHFLPGSGVLSFGSTGCTLSCSFCQNWQLSRGESVLPEAPMAPAELVRLARSAGCASVAYTYNEPLTFAEYALDVAQAATAAGLRNVMVSAGYVTPEARAEIFGAMDAANIDLKSFDPEFYRRHCRAELQPVLETLRWLAQASACWLEVTTLIIPGLNDDLALLRAQAAWMVRELGPEVPLHLSAFHPAHKVLDRPRTPLATLQAAAAVARAEGLQHVYLGNVQGPGESDTRCAGCGARLVAREFQRPPRLRLVDGGCPDCGRRLPGVWS